MVGVLPEPNPTEGAYSARPEPNLVGGGWLSLPITQSPSRPFEFRPWFTVLRASHSLWATVSKSLAPTRGLQSCQNDPPQIFGWLRACIFDVNLRSQVNPPPRRVRSTSTSPVAYWLLLLVGQSHQNYERFPKRVSVNYSH